MIIDPKISLSQANSDYKKILEKLMNSVSKDFLLSGNDFFDAVVKCVSEIFNAEYVFIGALNSDGSSIETISLSAFGNIVPNIEYDLSNTPCANVLDRNACCYASNAASLFPDDELLKQMEIEGYVGVSLYNSNQSPVGIIVALFKNEIVDTMLVETIIQLYATRTANELERMDISKKLEESNAHFFEVFNHAPIALIEVDLSGVKKLIIGEKLSLELENINKIFNACNIIDLNNIAKKLLKIENKELFKNSNNEFLISYKRLIFKILKSIYKGNLSGQENSFSFNIDKKDYEFSIHWIIPLKHHQTWSKMIISIEDVTKVKQLEKKLHHSQKMDAVGQLAGGVAHDFNNMLGGILGAAELIKNSGNLIGEEDNELLDIIISTASKSSDLTNKLLAFSRNNKTSLKLNNIHTIIDNTVSILKRTTDKRINIDIIKNAINPIVMSNETSIQNVILNLGINASHAMESGGNFTISTKNIILNKEYCDSSSFDISPGNFIEIEIKDTGKGISKEYKDKIFEPFFTTKTAGKGTGLGLSVVYGTITNYGGSITVDSKENQGTNFKILLPTSSKIVTKVEENHKIIKGEGTILLVDDEEIIRITTRNILKDMGYKVILAKDGLEAIKIYSKRAKEIDLIITDMIMPKMNGSDLFHKIKIINPNCPIIMVSGFVKDEDIYELKNIGFSGFLYKPYGYSNLSKVISKVLLENKDLKANIL